MPKQNTHPAEYPQSVLQQIELLGQHIAIARKRRGETQAQWARRLGVSQPTMARIERGDPSVAMATYVMCMWLVNPAVAVADLVAPLQDHATLEREVARVRAPRKKATAPGLQRARETSAARAAEPTAVRASAGTAPAAKPLASQAAARQANSTAAG
ncbi:MAG: XRE family transcriptional regulator, partial [Comamonadaceae bacterium]